MAKHRDVHKVIAKVFRLRMHTVLPWSSKRGLTRFHLSDVYKELGFKVGAEIGVRRGRYSKYLCQQNPQLKMYCIDPWTVHGSYTQDRQDGIYREFLANVAGLNVEVIRKTSMEAVNSFTDESLDFVFIDGNHKFDFVMEDLIYWSRKVRSGGIVSAHDYYPLRSGGVVPAVDAYTKCHCIVPWYATKELEPTAFWVKP